MGTGTGERHVARPRLTDVVAANRVTVVEAGAGFGKSALAAECAEVFEGVTVDVRLAPRDADPEVFVARLKRAFGRAGLSDVAAAGDTADDILDLLAQTTEPVLVALDDVHELVDTDAVEVVLDLASSLAAPHRLLLLGREMGGSLKKLRYAHGVVNLSADDLAFASDELGMVLRAHGVTAADHADAVARATGGWPAAAVLAARQLAKPGRHADDLDALTDPRDAVVELVRMVLGDLTADDRSALAQIAHLPILTTDVVTEAFGDAGLWPRLLAAGLPIGGTGDGYFELPGPVREHLASLETTHPSVAGRAASIYQRMREIRAAVDVLLHAGENVAAAEVVESLADATVQPMEFNEVVTLVEAFPDAAVAAHPRALLVLARMAERADRFVQRFHALTRLEEMLTARPDQALRDEFDIEVASDLLRLRESDLVPPLVAGIGERLQASQVAARIQLWVVEARYACRSGEFETGVRLFTEAKRLALFNGDRERAAAVTYALATEAFYYMGQLEASLEAARESLELASSPLLRLARLNLIADLATDLGRYEEAEAALAEQRELANRFRADRWVAYVAWNRARIASQKGDAVSTVRALDELWHHKDEEWFGPITAYVHTDSADMLARVGKAEAARDHIGQALALWARYPTNMIDALIEARCGDPQVAEAKLDGPFRLYDDGREAWRPLLFRALAAHRRGDARAAEFAADAFDRAGRDGVANTVLVREREVAEQLLGLAVVAGSAAAQELASPELPWTVTTLGGFEVRHGGAVVTLSPGKPTQAVKVVAAAGGRITLDELIDALWPEADIETGRRGVRNLLNRLKASADLLERDANDLVFRSSVSVDIAQFETESTGASAAHADDRARATLARAALARYRGEFLPSDRYEDWATVPRERAKRRVVEVIDLLVNDATARGEIDEVARLCDRAIDVDRYDEDRYVRAAALLAAHGRPTQALAVANRAAAMLAELDLEPSAALRTLIGQLNT